MAPHEKTLRVSTLGLLALVGCGAPDEAAPAFAAARQPIVGGYVDEETKGAVGLAANFLDIYFFTHCSGSLIAPNLVLTAQHCVALTQNETPTGGVVCGETDFGVTAGSQVFRATTLTVTPDEDGEGYYRGQVGQVITPTTADTLCGADVALIILEGEGIPASEATPLVPRIDGSPVPGDPYSAVGYGLQEAEIGPSGIRMRIDGNEVECVGESCGFGVEVEPSEWRGNAPTCQGDSGGPALDEEGRVIGVLSRGRFGCVDSVFGDVHAHRDLIIDTALEAAAVGGYDPPYWALTGSSTPPPPAEVGAECVGFCVGGAACGRFSENAGRTCLPACSADAPSCAAGTRCDVDQGACVFDPSPPSALEVGGGCNVGDERDASPGWLLPLLVLGWGRRRSGGAPATAGGHGKAPPHS